jgi:hypothetical protein
MHTLGYDEAKAEAAVRRNVGYLNRPHRTGGPLGATIEGEPVAPHPEDCP